MAINQSQQNLGSVQRSLHLTLIYRKIYSPRTPESGTARAEQSALTFTMDQLPQLDPFATDYLSKLWLGPDRGRGLQGDDVLVSAARQRRARAVATVATEQN